MSAMRARRCSTISSRRKKARNSCCASTTPMSNARSRNSKRRSSRIWPGSASSMIFSPGRSTAPRRIARRCEKLKALGLLYPAYETAAELDRKRKRQMAAHKPPVYDRAALALTAADRAKLEAEGRKPHWRFKLSQTKVRWRDLLRGEVEIDTATLVRSRADPRGRHAISTRPPPSPTTSTLPSRTSSAARITSPTRRRRSRSSKRWARPCRCSRISRCWSARAARRLSKRLGSLSLRSLREDGIEALARRLLSRENGHVRSGRSEAVAGCVGGGIFVREDRPRAGAFRAGRTLRR